VQENALHAASAESEIVEISIRATAINESDAPVIGMWEESDELVRRDHCCYEPVTFVFDPEIPDDQQNHGGLETAKA